MTMELSILFCAIAVGLLRAESHHIQNAAESFCTYALRDYVHACENNHIYTRCRRECDNYRLNCYECSAVEDPTKCGTTTTCKVSQKCLLTAYIDKSFRKRYNQTCVDESHCSIFHESGKRNDLHFPGYCCNHRQCNNQLVTPTVPPKDPLVCEDLTIGGCLVLQHQHPHICSHHDVAYEICPAMCATCHKPVTCYECDTLGNAEICNRTIPCETGKKCIAARTRDLTSLLWTFRMGCAPESVCSMMSSSGDVQCCDTDLCNKQSIFDRTTTQTTTPMTTTLPTTPTTIPTTPKPTTTTMPTTTTAIPTTTLRPSTTLLTTTHITYPPLSCDIDFVQVGGACYYINPKGRTEIWEDAKVICMALNSKLAEFETEAELNEMKKYLILHHGNDRHYSYWIGGVKNTQSSSWEWDSTKTAILNTPWNNKDTSPPGSCLEYGPMYDYQWNGGDCSVSSNFICEQ